LKAPTAVDNALICLCVGANMTKHPHRGQPFVCCKEFLHAGYLLCATAKARTLLRHLLGRREEKSRSLKLLASSKSLLETEALVWRATLSLLGLQKVRESEEKSFSFRCAL